MTLSGEGIYKAAFSGISKKTGKPYHILKFLDNEADEFATFFVEEELFQTCEFLEKNTRVALTIELKVNSKFVKLTQVEVIAD